MILCGACFILKKYVYREIERKQFKGGPIYNRKTFVALLQNCFCISLGLIEALALGIHQTNLYGIHDDDDVDVDVDVASLSKIIIKTLLICNARRGFYVLCAHVT